MPRVRPQVAARRRRVALAALGCLLACGRPPEPGAAAAPTPAPEGDARGEPAPPAAAIEPTAAEQVAAAEEAPAEPTPPAELPEGYLRFAGACDPGTTVTIAAVGDVLLHQELQRQAYAAKERHLALWGGVVDLLKRADLTYANLEGPMAAGIDRKGNTVPDPGASYDRVVYTAYPRFNYHPSLAQSLVDSGVDVVSTANNHALDREAIGVDKTLDALDEVKLAHTGTRRQGASERAPWHAITSAGDVRVAWLACAHTTNQIADEHHQVLHCYKDRALVLRLVRELARDPKIAAVIVTPHWGREYQTEPRKQEVKLAHELAEAGATAILGSHPHVLQPWERHTTQDGREVFIHYSLGNFASHQPELPRRSTVILYLALGVHEGRARVRGVGYVPLHVRQDGEQFFTEAIDRVDGPADSRALTVELLGRENLLAPDAPLSLAPHCQPGHRFPAP